MTPPSHLNCALCTLPKINCYHYFTLCFPFQATDGPMARILSESKANDVSTDIFQEILSTMFTISA